MVNSPTVFNTIPRRTLSLPVGQPVPAYSPPNSPKLPPSVSAAAFPPVWSALATQKQVMISPFGYPLTLFTLPNGHRIMVEQRPTDVVSLRTYVNTGSILENAMYPSPLYQNIGLPSGIAHLDEHCHFLTTEHFPVKNSVSQAIDRYGVMQNAHTSHEMVNHEVTFNREDLAPVSKLHAEMVLKPLYTPDTQQEKNAVINERALRTRPPDAKVSGETYRLLFDRPDIQTLGLIQDVQSATPEQMQRFYNMAYTPTNMMTVVSGNVDPDTVLNLIGPAFSANPPRNTTMGNQALQVALKPNEIRSANVTDPQLTNSMVSIGFPAPASGNYKERMAMEFLNQILSSDSLSLLPDQVVNRQHAAIGVGTGYAAFKQAGILQVMMEAQPGQEQTALASALNVIGQLAQRPVSEQTIAQIRDRLIQNFQRQQNDVELSTRLLGQEGVRNTLLYHQQYAQLANLVRPDDILAVARKYLNPNRYVVVFGKGPQAVQPAPLMNGAAGYFLQMPSQFRSIVNVVLPVGNMPPTTIDLLAQMLSGGSQASKQMLSQLSNQGISFLATRETDKLILSMEGPAGQEPLLAQALLRLITQPVLEPALFNDLKLRSIQSQQGSLNNPDDILRTALKQKIYGPNHPLGLSTKASIQSLAQVDLPGLFARFQQSLQETGGAKVMMISALPPAQQQQIVNSAILGSGWVRQPYGLYAGMQNNLPLPAASGVRGLVLVPTNASKRALIKTLWKTPDVRDPDYAAFRLLMDFLRGEDEGALLKTMRQDHGLVYTVGMSEGSKLAAGNYYGISVEVNGNQIGPALNDIRRVTRDAGRNPISPEVLDRLKRSMLRQTREDLQQARSISDIYAPWLTYDAPLPGPEWLENAIADVTPADIQRVANRIFNAPDGMQLVGVTAPEATLRQWFPRQPLTNPNA